MKPVLRTNKSYRSREAGLSSGRRTHNRLLRFISLLLACTMLMGFVMATNAVEVRASSSYVIVLDPGHDTTHARGAAKTSGMTEENWTLAIARAMKSKLESAGYTVYLTHGDTCRVPGSSNSDCLSNRVYYAKTVGCDLFISLHLNASGANDGTWGSKSGSEVYIASRYKTSMSKLASYVSTNLKSYAGISANTPTGTVLLSTQSTYGDGSSADYYKVIRESTNAGFPSILIEHGYMDNYSDSNKMKNAGTSTLGAADAAAVISWIKDGNASSVSQSRYSSSSGSSSSGKSGYVTGTTLNLRKSASTSASIVVTLKKYDILTLYELANGWYRVTASHNGSTYSGYVSAQYVAAGSPNTTSSGSSTKGYVNASAVNLRKSATTSSAVVITLSKGDAVSINASSAGWYKVTAVHGGATYNGYIKSDYVSIGSSSSGSSQSASGSGYVNASTLNLRSSASTSAGIIVKLSRNDALTLLESSNGWYKVSAKHNGSTYTGYVSAQYVKVGSSGSSSSASSGSGYVNANTLNLRSSASTSSSVVASLSRGDSLVLYSLSNGWYKVSATHGGKTYTGYVAAQYVTTGSSSSAASGSSSSGSSSSGSGYVNTSKLNLRKSASTNSAVIVGLTKNDIVTIQSSSNGWYQVTAKHNGTTYSGYVAAQYITRTGSSSASSSSGSTSGGSGYVNASSLNLRSAASTSAGILVGLTQGDSVTILSSSNGWYKVTAKHGGLNYTGYVASQYIKLGSK